MKSSQDSEQEKRPFRPYQSKLQYLMTCYLDTTDYLQREANRQWALDQSTKMGVFERDEHEMRYPEVFDQHKKNLLRAMHKELRKYPDYAWMKEFPGIGTVTAALLLLKVDIERADTVSKLWKFCGLAPDQKRRKGETLTYCAPLKDAMLQYVGQMTLLRTDPYRGI